MLAAPLLEKIAMNCKTFYEQSHQFLGYISFNIPNFIEVIK